MCPVCERRELELSISENPFVLGGGMPSTPTFFLVVAPKGFVPRDSGVEEAEWVLRSVLFGENLVVADDFCQRE